MEDCDYIIDVLNISRNSDFPWASLRTPKTFLSAVMNKIIEISPETSAAAVGKTLPYSVAVPLNGSQMHIPVRGLLVAIGCPVFFCDHLQVHSSSA